MTTDKSTGKSVKLGMNSLKGSSAIIQEADNFMVVSRPEKNKEGKLNAELEWTPDMLKSTNVVLVKK
jgi:hypothetical protein